VCLRYRTRLMLLCSAMWYWGPGRGKCYCVQWCVSEVDCEGNLLWIVMCVWVSGWGKCYFVQWCVSNVQDEEHASLYTNVCLRYMVKEMLLCTVVTFWGTVWWNVTEYSDVCLNFRIKEMLLCTVMCVWCTVWVQWYNVHWCKSEVLGEGNDIVYNDVCLR